MTHDGFCEVGNTHRAFNRPPIGECWCAHRAEGFDHWVYSSGAATIELSKVPAEEVPPNMLGGAA
jgi:hypothetical protein